VKRKKPPSTEGGFKVSDGWEVGETAVLGIVLSNMAHSAFSASR
jgi:hypothetical protein